MAATASESSKHARVESEQDKPVSADINCIAQLYRNFVQCDFSSQNLIFLLCTLVDGNFCFARRRRDLVMIVCTKCCSSSVPDVCTRVYDVLL